MQLLRVELKGFKSFADKTIVNFSTGLTAIVGPNGSGKSNITDAIRWVLGESNVRNLRGQKAEDIIFSGTAKRRPLTVAEVSLIFDNSDRSLPDELAEVAITRRLYRNGDSEFSINRRNCRLKDIHRLLADTGLGRDSMAIIGQNRVDAILNSKPEERRLIFEDVAGISGFKMNKEDAQRRIAATERNMERINDLLANLDEQLTVLEEKAGQTRQYNAMAKEKRTYDGALTFHEFKTAERLQTRLENENINLSAEDEELRTSSMNNEVLRRQLTELDEERQIALQKLEEKYSEVIQSTERVHGQVQLLEEQKRTLQRDVEERKARLAELKNNFDADTHRVLLLEKTIRDDLLTLAQKKIDREAAETAYENYASLWEKSRQLWTEADSADRERNIRLTEVLGAGDGTKAELQLLREQVKDNVELLTVLTAERDEAQSIYKKISSSWNSSREKMATWEVQSRENNALVKAQQEKRLQLQRNLDANTRQVQHAEGRLQLLQTWEDNHEGYAEATKAVLQTKAPWRSSLRGAVGELFSVEERFVTAIEIALGASVNHVISDSTKIATEAIAFLKEQHKGRTTFLPLEAVRGTVTDTPALRETGILGCAAECITYESDYRDVFAYLLGRTLIADTLLNATAVQKKYDRRLRIVTLAGDVLQPGGSLTGGSIARRKGAVLQRKNERIVLEAEILHLREQTEEYKLQLTTVENEEQNLRQQTEKIGEELRKLRLQEAVEEGQTKTEEERWLRKVRVFDETEERISTLTTQLEQLEKRSHDLEQEEAELRFSATDQTERDALLQQSNELQSKQQETHEILTRLRLEIEHGENGIEEKQSQVAEYRNNLAGYEDRKTPIASSLNEAMHKLETKIPAELEQLAQDNLHWQNESKLMETNRTAAYEDRKADQRRQHEVTEEAERLRQRREIVQRRLVEMEGRLTKVRLDAENALQNLTELGYTRDEAQQLTLTGRVQEWQSEQQVLAEAIAALGTINPNAIEEHEAAQQRRNFLHTQQIDLDEAKGQLETVIGEIDNAMAERFTEVFSIVSKGFQKIFEKLFGGGTAQLVLTDSTNILDAGIEMLIQPPGKKRQPLSLLSGGERALTVIALLFSFLDYRPAPFCVLDEVDAALDESNVERFSRYLNQLGDDTQFIVVTHRKPTMESARVLQGVTMAEQGVSQLLTVAFDDIKEEL